MPCLVKESGEYGGYTLVFGESCEGVGRVMVGGVFTLEDFEILKVGVFGIDVKFNSSHWHVLCGWS